MGSLARNYRDQQKHFGTIETRRKPHRISTLEAEIKVFQHGSFFVVTIALFASNKRIARDHLLLNEGECANSGRAWRSGYNQAQRLADEYAPSEPLYIRDFAENRGRAA